MHILIVDQFASLPSTFGFQRHYYISRELVRLGHEVTVMTSNFNHKTRSYIYDDPDSVENGRQAVVDGIRFVWLKATRYSGNDFRRVAGMFTFPKRVMANHGFTRSNRPDVILGSSPNLLTAYGAMRLARKLDVPFVAEIRDVHPDTLVHIGGYSKRNPAIMFLYRIEMSIYRNANAVISLLPNFSDHLAETGFVDKAFFHVPNGVDVGLFRPSPIADGEDFTFMYTGALGVNNSVHTLIRAIEALRDMADSPDAARIRLRIIGDGPKREELIAYARETGLYGQRVFIEPPVPQAEVSDKLSQADALIFYFRNSPLGRHGVSLNKVHEYLAVGRPILSIMSAANDPVGEAQAGLSIPGSSNPAEIAQTMLALSRKGHDERVRMADNGASAARDTYSFGIIGKKMEAALRHARDDGKDAGDPA